MSWDENYANTFRVEDGLLKSQVMMAMKLSTDSMVISSMMKSFSHYLYRVEYRFVGEQARKEKDGL